jgi:hypothetical protein
MPKAAHQFDMCANCQHTVNVHTKKSEVGPCRAHNCDCQEYVKS